MKAHIRNLISMLTLLLCCSITGTSHAADAEYDYIWNYHNGVAQVEKDGRFGFINEDGEIQLPVVYDDVAFETDGLIYLAQGFYRGFANQNAELLVDAEYFMHSDWAFTKYTGGVFRFKTAEPEWPHTGFSDVELEETARVLRQQKIGFVTKSGRVICEPAWSYASIMVDGIAIVGMEKDCLTYVNYRGETLGEPQWTRADYFSEGRAYVEKPGLCGYVDQTGILVISLPDATYSDAEIRMESGTRASERGEFEETFPWDIYRDQNAFTDGRAAVQFGELWGFIDREGNEVIPRQFEEVYPFWDGAAPVKMEYHWGLIDTEGSWIIEPEWQDVRYVDEVYGTMHIYRCLGSLGCC